MARAWCFTLNNYSEIEYESLKTLKCDYIILGKEKGENETPHIQGYVEFPGTRRLVTVKKINARIHWEPRRGSQEQAINYCMKDGDFEEIGVKKEQGKRTDIDAVKEIIKEEKGNLRDVLEKATSMQSIRYAEKYFTYNETKRNWKTEVTWIWGPSGVGKSKLAHELAGEEFYSKDGEKWWDGYDQHEIVIIDDFRGSNMKFNYLLKVLDRYPMRVEVKGGYRQLLAKKIYVTSIMPPESVYVKLSNEPMQQLIRRIDKTIMLSQPTQSNSDNTAVWSTSYNNVDDVMGDKN